MTLAFAVAMVSLFSRSVSENFQHINRSLRSSINSKSKSHTHIPVAQRQARKSIFTMHLKELMFSDPTFLICPWISHDLRAGELPPLLTASFWAWPGI